jgi:hypothetical protein
MRCTTDDDDDDDDDADCCTGRRARALARPVRKR